MAGSDSFYIGQLCEYSIPISNVIISREPFWLSSNEYLYQSLDPKSERLAVRARNQSGEPIVQSISEILTSESLSSTNVNMLLSKIMQDLKLVHAAYYTYPGAIEQVARTIALADISRQERKETMEEVCRQLSAGE